MRKLTGSLDLYAMGKPRMTRRDRYLNPPRRPVAKYRAFKTYLNLGIKIPSDFLPGVVHLVVHYEMPPSWSEKKKKTHLNKPKTTVPDKDNIEKAFYDALFKEDKYIWGGSCYKYWSFKNCINYIIEELEI